MVKKACEECRRSWSTHELCRWQSHYGLSNLIFFIIPFLQTQAAFPHTCVVSHKCIKNEQWNRKILMSSSQNLGNIKIKVAWSALSPFVAVHEFAAFNHFMLWFFFFFSYRTRAFSGLAVGVTKKDSFGLNIRRRYCL